MHPVGTIIELKRRLGKGRRCFAFFHPSVPDEPLVFVHVALVKELAGSMPYIKDDTEKMDDETQARAAIFYSISSTQKGLQVSMLVCWLRLSIRCDLHGGLSVLSEYRAWILATFSSKKSQSLSSRTTRSSRSFRR